MLSRQVADWRRKISRLDDQISAIGKQIEEREQNLKQEISILSAERASKFQRFSNNQFMLTSEMNRLTQLETLAIELSSLAIDSQYEQSSKLVKQRENLAHQIEEDQGFIDRFFFRNKTLHRGRLILRLGSKRYR